MVGPRYLASAVNSEKQSGLIHVFPNQDKLTIFVAVPLIPCYTERGEMTPWLSLCLRMRERSLQIPYIFGFT